MAKGLAEAKIISPAMMGVIEARLEEYAAFSQAHARDLAFVRVGCHTAFRVSELAHLKAEDVLEEGVVITSRKKKELVPRPIAVNPEGSALLKDLARDVKSGYLFPGKAAPCLIHRRPKFDVEECPDCGDRIAPLSMVKKKSDRISLFFRHLNVEHGRSPEEVREWIDFVSVSVTQKFCGGGHVSIRAFAKRWNNLMKDLGIYQHGRGIHCVRHAAITRFYNDTRDLMATREFARHESVEMTKGYTHIELKDKMSAVKWSWPKAVAK